MWTKAAPTDKNNFFVKSLQVGLGDKEKAQIPYRLEQEELEELRKHPILKKEPSHIFKKIIEDEIPDQFHGVSRAKRLRSGFGMKKNNQKNTKQN